MEFHLNKITVRAWQLELNENLHPAVLLGDEQFAIGCRFSQSLGRCSMILLVPSLILAVLVLAWIAWIAFEPRSSTVPSTHPLQNNLLGVAATSEARKDESETDYQRHIRNRIEEPQVPLGTVAGASSPDGGRITQRAIDPDAESGEPMGNHKGRGLESNAHATSRAWLN